MKFKNIFFLILCGISFSIQAAASKDGDTRDDNTSSAKIAPDISTDRTAGAAKNSQTDNIAKVQKESCCNERNCCCPYLCCFLPVCLCLHCVYATARGRDFQGM